MLRSNPDRTSDSQYSDINYNNSATITTNQFIEVTQHPNSRTINTFNMQFSSSNLIAIVAALSHVASATVFTGTLTLPTGDKRNVAWTNGALNPCEETSTIGSGSGNPCGQVFSAGGVGGFELVGCGGNGLTLFQDGQFNSNCAFQPQQIGGCPGTAKLEQSFACFA